MKEDRVSPEPLIEPLTRREREILALLADGLSGPEIAAKLTLALSSVRWHLQQIYGKLGVNGKHQAVARARELGLLPFAPPVALIAGPSDLRSEASLSSPARPQHNLPAQISSFIGREKEIAEIQALLLRPSVRLVTLTGSGGVGKTRLALQAAAGLLDNFPDGAWLVELASLADPGRVAQAAAAALGVHESPGRPAAVALSDYLRAKHLLLILDNCEHVVSACAELAHHLLQVSPRMSILATSRERLGVGGEIIFHVPSLTTPNIQDRPDPEIAGSYEAVRLFVERAQRAFPGYCLTEENAPVIAQICQRLDGIPLAIELAAARLRLLSAMQIASRLDDVFRLLTGGSRTALPRHQTLRASIDWSYNLLTSQEQELLQTLSVFAGGWTLEAAEAVCANGDVLDGLGQLVDKSLVIAAQEAGGQEPRYHMLETIRQYADEKLSEAGISEQARDRHLSYYLAFAERLEPELRGRHQIARLDQLEAEMDNLRTALFWALKTNLEAELRLVSALKWFWHMHTRHMEGLEWLEPGLARIQTLDDTSAPIILPSLRAKALATAGALYSMQFQSIQAEMKLKESLGIYRKLGSEGKMGIADVLFWQGINEFYKDEYSRASALFREGLAHSRDIQDLIGTGKHLLHLSASLEKNEPGNLEARKIIQEALELSLDTGDLDGLATAYHHMAYMALHDRKLAHARSLFEQSLFFHQQVGNRVFIGFSWIYLGQIAHIQRDFSAAIECTRTAIAIQRDTGSLLPLAAGLFQMGTLNLLEGNPMLVGSWLAESLALSQEAGDKHWVACNYLLLGKLAWAEGDGDLARQRLADALAAGQEVTNPDLAANLLAFQSLLAWSGGDEKGAEAGLREALKITGKINWDMYGATWAIDLFAQVKSHQQPERASRLFGAVEHLNWCYPYFLNPVEWAGREAALAQVKADLGEQRFTELWAEGKAMTSEQAIAYALEEEKGGIKPQSPVLG